MEESQQVSTSQIILSSDSYIQNHQKIKKISIKSISSNREPLRQKRKYVKKKKVQAIPTDQYFLQLNKTLILDEITQVTSDGILRYLPSLNQISLNYLMQKIQRIEEMKELGVVSIQYNKASTLQRNSLESVMKQIYSVPGFSFQDIQQLLSKYTRFVSKFVHNLSDMNQEMVKEKDDELKEFIEFAYNQISGYVKHYQKHLYFYTISRINLELKQQETAHIGYSKGYLDLLGIDLDSINQIFLRNKKIDLAQFHQDISIQTLNGLHQMTQSEGPPQQEIYESNIITFDGYPLKIYQKKKSACNIFKPKKNYGHDHEYLLTIMEIDVDLQSLQELLDYRKRISEQSSQSSINDFLRRENSYLFEDVEYSVQSQQFIDKFYGENVKNVQLIQQQLIDQKQQCGYRFIKK